MRPTATKTTYTITGDAKLIIPLNNGHHAYVINPTNGKNPKYATDSDAYKTAIIDLVNGTSVERVRKEVVALIDAHPDYGWERPLEIVDTITSDT